jgi:hypothetical protein
MVREKILLAMLLLFLAGCGAEETLPASRAVSRPQPLPDRDEKAARKGPRSFAGATPFHCVLHDERGLQINLRTGDPELPAVAVRLDEYRGSGTYPARLYVTGRSRTGALVRSAGEASLEIEGKEVPGAPALIALSGSFEGTYGGQAGKGSLRGRFTGCSYRQMRGGAPLLADRSLESEQTSGP